MTTKDAMIELKAGKPTGRYIFSNKQFRNLRRLFDTLDEDPEAWRIYGDSFRYTALDMWITICKLRKKVRQLKGMGAHHGSGEGTAVRRPDLQAKFKLRRFHEIGKCEHCGMMLEGDEGWAIARLDHVVPVSWGGLTTYENTQLLCANCDARKTAEDSKMLYESGVADTRDMHRELANKHHGGIKQSVISARKEMNKGADEEWSGAAKSQLDGILARIYERGD